ncbi:MAG: hypothetical protein K6T57_16025 [Thermaceae bacterium]|nr:hypothetical protein [Thermaceae bacterium]
MNPKALSPILQDSYSRSSLAREGWANALLDEHFLLHHLAPLLAYHLEAGCMVEVESVAQLWARHLGLSEALGRRWAERISPAIADFLLILKANLKAAGTTPRLAEGRP